MKFKLSKTRQVFGFFKRGKKSKKDQEVMKRIGRFRMRCNLCTRVFRANSRFLRFCRSCRVEDEIFRFAECLGT